MDRYLTVEEVAKLFSVKIDTIRDWAKKGKLTGRKIGRRWIFSEENIKI